MDLVQLEYFKTVAESGHLTNAAKKLNVAQPTLSVSIARLENEIGVPLFDRAGRGIYLNKCGEIYLEYAEQVLHIMKRAKQEIDAYCEKKENVLTLGVVSKPFSQMMLLRFQERFPDASLRQVTITSEHVEEELEKEEVDYVISSRRPGSASIVSELVRRERMLLAVSAAHPLAACEWIRLSDAMSEEFISLPKGYEHRMITDEMCRNAGFTANVTRECFYCNMTEMVAAGMGVALMTEGQAEMSRGNPRIRFIPVEDPDYWKEYFISWKAGHHFNTIARGFRKYIREYYEENGTQSCVDCS